MEYYAAIKNVFMRSFKLYMNCSFKKQDKTLYMQYEINYVKIQRHKIKTGRKVIKLSVVSISEWGLFGAIFLFVLHFLQCACYFTFKKAFFP